MARLPAIALLLLSLLLSARAFAETRLALVITNKDYPASVGALSNPHSDGERIARTLTRLGFSVVHKRDLTKDQMLAELSAYTARLTGAGRDTVGFFYYSGHGAANSTYGENYLIPVAAPMTLDSQLVLFGVKAGDVIDALSATPVKANFVVLDSCRDVPLEFALRGEGRGLRSVKERRGMLVAFATDPGKTATDSGVYAEALAAELERPGEEASHVFRAVRRRVLEATAGKQFPWHADGLLDDFYFIPQQVAAAKPADPPQAAPSLPPIEPETGSQQQAAAAPAPIAAAQPVEEAPKPEKPKDNKVASVEPAKPSPKPAGVAKLGEAAAPRRREVAAPRLVRTFSGYKSLVTAVTISPDSRTVLSGDWDGSLKLWDIASGRELRSMESDKGRIVSLAFSPDGRTALSASDSLILWDLASGRNLRTLGDDRYDTFRCVAFSPDGRLALSAMKLYSKPLILWDVASGREVHVFPEVAENVFTATFSPDGRFALSASGDDKTLKLWDIASGRELRRLSGHTGWVNSVAISPDGRMALSASDDKTLKLWDIASGSELRSFSDHAGDVNLVAISPDGRFALSDSCDERGKFRCKKGSLKLWEIASGKEVRSFAGYPNIVPPVTFSSDGRFALSASCDEYNKYSTCIKESLKLWDISEWTHAPAASVAK